MARLRYSNPILTLEGFDVPGAANEFVRMRMPGWVSVVPVTEDGDLVCVRQHRWGLDASTLELPAGVVDVGEDPRDAAARELLEETGYGGGVWRDLGWVHPNPALQDNRCGLWAALGVRELAEPTPDPTELLEVVLHPLADARGLLDNPEFSAALSVVVLQRLLLYNARMSDPLDSPRIRELLEAADKALAMRETVSSPSAEEDLHRALETIWVDLGRAVYGLVRNHSGPAPDDPLQAGDTTDTETLEATPQPRREGWYTNEIDASSFRGNVFDPGDLEPEDDQTDVPESEPQARSGSDTGTDVTPIAETFDGVRYRLQGADGALEELRMGAPTWRGHFDELLTLLGPPIAGDTPAAIAEESSRLQWAASALEERLSGIPDDLQAAIVGMLSSRAQHLRSASSQDVGPRLALDAMQRYRISEGLPMLAPLTALPAPELGSWLSDAERWWALLDTRTP